MDHTSQVPASDAAISTNPVPPPSLSDAEREELSRCINEFFCGLRFELNKVNAFFLDKQEDYVILSEQLGSDVERILETGATRTQLLKLKQRLVEFHGCLVLLDNFSHVNYQGFRKILKKLDKKTGLRVRETYLSSVAVTPFLLSDTVRHLLRDTERRLEQLNEVTKFRRGNEDRDGAGQRMTEATSGSQGTGAPSASSVARQTVRVNRDDGMSSSSSSDDASHSCRARSMYDNTNSAEMFGTDSLNEAPNSGTGDIGEAVASLNHAQAQFRALLHTMISASAVPVAYSRAFMRARSALYQVWSRAMSHLKNSTESFGAGQNLVDSVCSLTQSEVGIHQQFLEAAPSPADYVIAATTDLAMGFLILGPDDHPLQLFKRHHPGICITRLMHGSATMHMFSSRDIPGNSEDTSLSGSVTSSRDGAAEGVGTEQTADTFVTVRSGVAVGPWPAVSVPLPDYHVQWTPNGSPRIVIFYVMSPTLETQQMPQYALTRIGSCSSTVAVNSGDCANMDNMFMAETSTNPRELYSVVLKSTTGEFERIPCY